MWNVLLQVRDAPGAIAILIQLLQPGEHALRSGALLLSATLQVRQFLALALQTGGPVGIRGNLGQGLRGQEADDKSHRRKEKKTGVEKRTSRQLCVLSSEWAHLRVVTRTGSQADGQERKRKSIREKGEQEERMRHEGEPRV